MHNHTTTPDTPETKAARVIARAANQGAKKHRGETALQFHLSQWAEECAEYTLVENYIMLEAARLLLREGE